MLKEVWLYGVGRNLNRAVRTCASFGVVDLVLVKCTGEISGNLYSAARRVCVRREEELPAAAGTLALETWYSTPLRDVCWGSAQRLLLGGETGGLPRVDVEQRAAIFSGPPSLTVEAALAIALYEASLC